MNDPGWEPVPLSPPRGAPLVQPPRQPGLVGLPAVAGRLRERILEPVEVVDGAWQVPFAAQHLVGESARSGPLTRPIHKAFIARKEHLKA